MLSRRSFVGAVGALVAGLSPARLFAAKSPQPLDLPPSQTDFPYGERHIKMYCEAVQKIARETMVSPLRQRMIVTHEHPSVLPRFDSEGYPALIVVRPYHELYCVRHSRVIPPYFELHNQYESLLPDPKEMASQVVKGIDAQETQIMRQFDRVWWSRGEMFVRQEITVLPFPLHPVESGKWGVVAYEEIAVGVVISPFSAKQPKEMEYLSWQ